MESGTTQDPLAELFDPLMAGAGALGGGSGSGPVCAALKRSVQRRGRSTACYCHPCACPAHPPSDSCSSSVFFSADALGVTTIGGELPVPSIDACEPNPSASTLVLLFQLRFVLL